MSDDDVARWQLEQEAVETMLDYSTPQKISKNPYAMVCDLKPGDGEIGRIYGVDVWMVNGEPYTGDAGDETE